MAGLVVLLFTMPGMSTKGSHDQATGPEPASPAVENTGAANAPVSGISAQPGARTSARDNPWLAGYSKSVTIVAGVLFLLPFAASTFQVLRRNRPV